MGKKSPPDPDPQIGAAALESARLGSEYLGFMRRQARITNRWAEEDRSRYNTVFQPLQDEFIADAQSYDTPERRAAAASAAVGDVRQQAEIARQSSERNLASMGIDPRSGAYAAEARRGASAESLAAAGAANAARRQVEATGDAKQAAAIDMGNGLAVNPAQSMGLSNNATSAGFNGAMGGQQQKGNLLNTQYQNQLQSWQARNSVMGGIGSALGMLGGAFIPSSKEIKTDKRPVKGALKALKDMPVEAWTYKPGNGDGKRHIGPYAEDFQKATGQGDGKSISLIDSIGITMAGIKELAEEVSAMKRRAS